MGAVVLLIGLLAVYAWSIDIRASRGASITGDEPFYLITTQSLIEDGDLDLRNQYEARSYESFFDHPDGLWTQSLPLEEGALLSPHNVGLSVLLVPGFAIGGLVGAQLQLVLMGALAWALAYVLALRLTRVRPLIVFLATAAVALSATAFIYASEVYPEVPAGLVLVAALLVATGNTRPGVGRVLMLVVLLSALPWLGAKYAPLAALLAIYVLWRADTPGRAALVAGGALSAVAYAAFHLATYESLTPYNVNLVYAGGSTAEIVGEHVELGDRVYRLWGLLIDRRFGVARWAPLLFGVLPGAVLLARGDARLRLVLGLVVTQLLIATFVAITMMGWWFPGRTLVTIFPLLPIPLAVAAARGGRVWRGVLVALGAYSVAVTAALAQAGHAREVVIAVDPFELRAGFFSRISGLFPQYTSWTTETWLLTVAWLGLVVVALVGCVLRTRSRRGPRQGPEHPPSETSARSPSRASVSR